MKVDIDIAGLFEVTEEAKDGLVARVDAAVEAEGPGFLSDLNSYAFAAESAEMMAETYVLTPEAHDTMLEMGWDEDFTLAEVLTQALVKNLSMALMGKTIDGLIQSLAGAGLAILGAEVSGDEQGVNEAAQHAADLIAHILEGLDLVYEALGLHEDSDKRVATRELIAEVKRQSPESDEYADTIKFMSSSMLDFGQTVRQVGWDAYAGAVIREERPDMVDIAKRSDLF